MKPKTQHLPAPIKEKKQTIEEEAEEILPREEWDFSNVADEFVEDCWRWEWPRSCPDITGAVLAARAKNQDAKAILNRLRKLERAKNDFPTMAFNDAEISLTCFVDPQWPKKPWQAARGGRGAPENSSAIQGPMKVIIAEPPLLPRERREYDALLKSIQNTSMIIAVSGWPLKAEPLLKEIRRLLPEKIGKENPKGHRGIISIKSRLRNLGAYRLKKEGMDLEEIIKLKPFDDLVQLTSQNERIERQAVDTLGRELRKLRRQLDLG